MNKLVSEINIDNKRVVVRVDYNVPVKNEMILDVNKINESLETINYLIDRNCKIVLLSHFGKVKEIGDMDNNSLEIVYEYLKKIVSTKVSFCKSIIPSEMSAIVSLMEEKEVLLLENTRFFDVDGKLESSNNEYLGQLFASFGDYFILDAFASSHREHASTCGISNYIPSCFGFLVAKEMKNLDLVVNPVKPLTIVMGGAKIDDKLKIIKSLLPKCDNLIVGGGIANTFLKVSGINVASSLCSNDEEVLDEVTKLYNSYKDKIALPIDWVLGREYDDSYVNYSDFDDITNDDQILDIGTKSVAMFKNIIDNSGTVFINGTVGKYEDVKFANGSKEMLKVIAESKAVTVAGGGDAVASINSLGLSENFDYLSTGGGATLLYIADGSLVALDKVKGGL